MTRNEIKRMFMDMRRLRLALRKTQAEAAQQLDVTQAALSRLESGKTENPKKATLDRAKQVYDEWKEEAGQPDHVSDTATASSGKKEDPATVSHAPWHEVAADLESLAQVLRSDAFDHDAKAERFAQTVRFYDTAIETFLTREKDPEQ